MGGGKVGGEKVGGEKVGGGKVGREEGGREGWLSCEVWTGGPPHVICSNFVLYSQAVKRLMTFCQRKFETDPSKSVEYHGLQATN